MDLERHLLAIEMSTDPAMYFERKLQLFRKQSMKYIFVKIIQNCCPNHFGHYSCVFEEIPILKNILMSQYGANLQTNIMELVKCTQ